ncbi:uncharacterized protein MELLADRAFT_32752 [Melampsora larici-populina 98AG31]|uniref:Uncharacterized protein n=1 Tax=Melampsora larici-populina (strain 98AG31 / pathotype 3-4-7) TaxID=747676 RepID=F4R4Z0_MELLP|nr:uncharacterized protein MELLADRAFT_32752 [Melampsora larici-populina 98AG31]EGG11964.1 hypothetical protein MELLADRAFT_32752 [Melampsora larici-populina 98AG31]
MIKRFLDTCEILVWLFALTHACGDHVKRHQPSASDPTGRPYRELQWGDLNIIHTTDTHGWLMGHLHSQEPEPNYSGDFGDFQSFVYRMKEKAAEKGVDLLVIDTGDLHDGNGLSDAEPLVHIGTPRGSTSNKYFARVPYDILTIGNHELYDLPIAQDMHDNFAPVWNGSYLTSNVNITTSGTSVPIGSRYRKFKTTQGRTVTAFGITFHFTANANGTVVQPPTELVKEAWFLEAIRERPDVFILTGHMGAADDDWKVVLEVIRKLHPKVPIMILGGHYHIRDCRQLDSHSMSISSGRYMETIGWMSVQGLNRTGDVSFSRRYLDQNRVTYAFHAGSGFDTEAGINTTHAISETANKFNITYKFGTAPQSYFNYRVPITANNSMTYLLTGPEGVLRSVVRSLERPHPPLIALNSGSIRFDIFKGDFTVNDELITMPFKNAFVYAPNVPRDVAAQFIDALNTGGIGSTRRRRSLMAPDENDRNQDYHTGQNVEEIYMSYLRNQPSAQTYFGPIIRKNARSSVTPESYGYVTKDSCPGVGDDTPHIPLPVYDPPEYVGTPLPPDAEEVDVVFYDFISSFALKALNKVQSTKTYTKADLLPYVDILGNQMFGLYAQQKWN